jgi:hypothetical protein
MACCCPHAEHAFDASKPRLLPRTWALPRMWLWVHLLLRMMLAQPWCPQPWCCRFQMPLRSGQRVECSGVLQGRSRKPTCSGNWPGCEREWGDYWRCFIVVEGSVGGCELLWLACDGRAMVWRSLFPCVGAVRWRGIADCAPSTPCRLCDRLWAASCFRTPQALGKLLSLSAVGCRTCPGHTALAEICWPSVTARHLCHRTH